MVPTLSLRLGVVNSLVILLNSTGPDLLETLLINLRSTMELSKASLILDCKGLGNLAEIH